MRHAPRILSLGVLSVALGCGDSTGETATDASTSAGSTTGTTAEPPTTGTNPTETSPVDTTAVTSLDSSDGGTTAGGVPEIEVSVGGRPLASGDSLAIAPVDVGAASDAVLVNIENTGGADLTISGVALQAGDAPHFVLDDAALDGTLVPGASTSFSVAFAPQSGGRKQVEVRIDSDDADEGAYVLVVDTTSTPNTWRDVAPASAPPARFNAAMAATDDGRVVLFGGRLASGMRVADTWVLDVEAGDWTELAPPASPSARDASAMAFAGSGTVVLFGGTETSGPGGSVTPRSDTWVLDVDAATWTELLPDTPPPERFQHAMASVGDDGVVLYGGRPEFGLELADTWLLDAAGQWTDLAPATSPGPRSAFALASDGAGRLVMVGGSPDGASFVDETWAYDATGNAWAMGAAAGLGPQFNNAAAWLDGDVVVTFSGKADCCSDPVPGTWAYDAAADAWTDLAPAVEPAPRFSHRMVAVGGNKAIVFGGLLLNANLGSASAETWEYVGPLP